jgi:hypothetical protein
MAICHQPSASRRATSIWSGLRRLGYIKNQALLDRLEMMKPGPNGQRLAQELAEQNKALPREQRHGPRGSTNPITLESMALRDNRDNAEGNFKRRASAAPPVD